MVQLLITGASGFLGGILAKALNFEYNITTLGRKQKLDIRCDLAHQVPIIDTIPDYVIHAAGLAHFYPSSPKDERRFFEANYNGTKNLLSAFDDRSGPKGFIYISSVSVYGLESGTNILETQDLNGFTPYAQSKIQAEELVLEWGQKNKVTTGILRLPLVCGANPPGNLGSMIRSFKAGRYPKIGKGDNRKSMVYGPDIPKVIPALFEKGGIFHLTDGHHPSINEIENALELVTGNKPALKIPKLVASTMAKIGNSLPYFPINSAKLQKISGTLTFNDDKARKELGYTSTRVLDVMDKIAR